MPQSMLEVESEPQPRSQERVKKKNRKWTFGGLFRRKKGKETSSDSSDSEAAEDGKKGGFLARRRRRRTANRGSKDVTESFEHVVLRPAAGAGAIVPGDGRKSVKARVEASREVLCAESSSDEDRSPRIPRAHRSSKRISRDMTDCSGIKVVELDSSPRSSRWTAKVVYCESSDYEARYTARTRSPTPSPAQSPKVARATRLPPRPQHQPTAQPRPFYCQKSASFDLLPRPNHQNYQNPRIPPPPPPRDPQRKILPPLGYTTSYDRPLSYAFESNQPMPKLMMDYNSNITAYKMPSSGSLDKRRTYQYYTDQQPRSRRPIHIARADQQPYLSDSQIGRVRSNSASSDCWRIPRDSNSSLCDSSDSREGLEVRPLSMVLEAGEQLQNGETVRHHQQIPRQQHHHNQQKIQQQQVQYQNQQNRVHQKEQMHHQRLQQQQQQQQQNHQQQQLQDQKDLEKQYRQQHHPYYHRKSNNLEDALDELEAIYKSLQMRDEDPPSSRGFESDSGCYRVVDDMAYRRLNRKDSGGSPDSRLIASQAGSYLLVSPTLSPPPFTNAPPVVPTQENEPDVTLDDVVYRNIRHTNNTLKISDPQPPFGIPVGPIAPAPSSDYLHATPKEVYRPTFKPRKTPDIVKDDLAYRNLRKDRNNDSLLTVEDGFVQDNTMKKKRAVRSLSANLLNIIQKENFCTTDNKSYSFDNHDDLDKSRSYSDLPDILSSRHKVHRSGGEDSEDATPRVSRVYPEVSQITTSTETLTDSRTDIMAAQEYCSNRQNQARLPNGNALPKTDLKKLRLPSPHKVSSSPPRQSKFLHCVNNERDSPTYYATPAKYIQNSNYNLQNFSASPTTVNLEKYMQRYENNTTSPYSNSSPVHQDKYPTTKTNGVENHNWTNINNRNRSPYQTEIISNNFGNAPSSSSLTPSPVFGANKYAERNMCHDTSDSPKIEDEDYFAKPLVISINTDKYLRENHVRTDPSRNKQNSSDSHQELSYQSSPLIYIGKPLDKVDHGKSESRNVYKPIVNSSVIKDSNQCCENFYPSSTPINDSVQTDVGLPTLDGKFMLPNAHPYQVTAPSLQMDNNIKVQNLKQQYVETVFEPTKENIPKQSSQLRTSTSQPELLASNVPSSKDKIPADKPISTKNGNTTKAKVPSPRPHSSHEKSHQKSVTSNCKLKPLNSRQNLHGETSNDSIDSGKRSPGNSVPSKDKNERSKQNTSNNKLSINSDKTSSTDKPRIPSPRLSLTPDRSVGENTSKNRVPSPRLSLIQEKKACNEKSKSPVQISETQPSSGKSIMNHKIEPKVAGSRIFSPNDKPVHSCCRTPSPNPRQVTCRNDKCDTATEEPPCKEDTNAIFQNKEVPKVSSHVNVLLTSDKRSAEVSCTTSQPTKSLPTAEFISKTVNNSLGIPPPESPKRSSANISAVTAEQTVTLTSEENLQDDLSQLLSEINTKQQKLLNDRSKLSKYETAVPSAMDKKDGNVSIGKITQHRPVKLNTFFINDKDVIENNQTTLTGNDNEIVGSSESMTDLLRELTRSLDQDFGNQEVRVSYGKTQVSTIESKDSKSVDDSTGDVSAVESILRDSEQKEEEISVTGERNVYEREPSKDLQNDKESDIRCEEKLFSEENPDELPDNSDNMNEDRTADCPSDDSNAEFVEQICKTASELSALSSSTPSSTSDTTATGASPDPASERSRRCRPQQAQQPDHQSEGIVNSRMSMLKLPLVHTSGLMLLCTHCMAPLHQLADVDFLTMLGLFIAVVSLLLLLIW